MSRKEIEKKYTNLGVQNSWIKTPAKAKKCKSLQHKLSIVRDPKGYENFVCCTICKYFYTYDSSD